MRVVAHPTIRENRQFVTDESVEFRNNWLKVKTAGSGFRCSVLQVHGFPVGA